MMDIVGGIILEDSTTNFSTYEHLFLTAKDQFMGGWWTATYEERPGSFLVNNDLTLWKLNPK